MVGKKLNMQNFSMHLVKGILHDLKGVFLIWFEFEQT